MIFGDFIPLLSRVLIVGLFSIAVFSSTFGALDLRHQVESSPESRAVAYLSREVPRWYRENRCFSCHNNGDAARALFHAARLSYPVPPSSLEDTARWLSRPEGWDDNKGDPAFSDKALARLQFASALIDAVDARFVADPEPIERAARLVLEHQAEDGSWRVEAAGSIGSPATYGASLATAMGRRLLLRGGRNSAIRTGIARADAWLASVRVRNVLDAASVLLGLRGRTDEKARIQMRLCLDIVRAGQTADGGWGPYPRTPPEAFDTAVVLLALSRHGDDPAVPAAIRRGREFLIRTQESDGSWRESTRPPGAESYAQRLSTTGWATQALLATEFR